MNVTCSACQAKYAVADEKVRGKKVRITCKRCNNVIVIDGTGATVTEGSASAPAPAPSAEPAPAPAAPAPEASPQISANAEPAPAAARPASSPQAAPAGAAVSAAQASRPRASRPTSSRPATAAAVAAAAESTWLVGFSNDRQEAHTTAKVVELYVSGAIDEDTFCWKEDMKDWATPFEIPEIAQALADAGQKPSEPHERPSGAQQKGAASPPPAQRESRVGPYTAATRRDPDGWKRSTWKRAEAAEAAAAAVAPDVVAPATAAAAPTNSATEEPVRARRSQPQAAGRDLFGSVASAGSEDDASLVSEEHEVDFNAPRMTGARNESSVLFTLEALTQGEKKPDKAAPKPRDKRSDADAASFLTAPPDARAPSLPVADLGLSPSLVAPDFTRPISTPPEPPVARAAAAAPSAPKRGGGMVWVALFVTLAIGGGVAAGFGIPQRLYRERFAPQPDVPPSAAAPAACASAPTPLPAESQPSAAASVESPAPSSSASAEEPASSAAASAPEPAAAAPAGPARPKAEPGAAAKPNEPKPTAPAKEPPKEEAPSTAPPFSRDAAAQALGAAAANAGSCRKAGGPTGAGRVSVTFAPSGRTTNTSVTGAFAGTEVGGCVARLFRAARVPAFSGDAVTVSKSFSIE